MDLHALHEKASVNLLANDTFIKGTGERRPARAGLELVSRIEQRLAATHTAKRARSFDVIQGRGKGAFGSVLAGNLKLLLAQAFFPLGIG